MKKSVDYICLSSSSLKQLLEMIDDRDISLNELTNGLRDLQSGFTTSLVLQLNVQSAAIDNSIKLGDALEIDPRSHLVYRDGKQVYLTPKEFDILYFLAKNRGEVFTKEQIYQAVWNDEYALGDSNIMAFIRKLRKKIEPQPDSPKYIITSWGIGYKFTDEYD